MAKNSETAVAPTQVEPKAKPVAHKVELKVVHKAAKPVAHKVEPKVVVVHKAAEKK